MAKKKWILMTLFVMSLLFNTAYLLYLSDGDSTELYFNDEFVFYKIAKQMSSGNLTFSSEPSSYNLGYPFFLSSMIQICGDNLFLIRLTQAMIVSILPVLVFLLANFYFKRKVSFLAAIITAFLPALKLSIPLLMKETIYTVVFLTAYYFLIKFFKKKQKLDSIGSLIFFIVAILTRTETVFFLFMILIVLSFYLDKQYRTKVQILLVLLIFISFLAVNFIKNQENSNIKHILEKDTQTAFLSFWETIHKGFDFSGKLVSEGYSKNLSIGEYRELKFGNLPTEEKTKKMKEEFLKIFYAHPEYYLRGMIQNFLIFSFGDVSYLNLKLSRLNFRDSGKEEKILEIAARILIQISHILIVILGISGMTVLFIKNRFKFLVYSAPWIFKMILHTFLYAESRYQIPMLPFTVITASYFLVFIRNKLNKKRTCNLFKNILA